MKNVCLLVTLLFFLASPNVLSQRASNEIKKESYLLVERMVDELNKPYNPSSNNLLIREYEEFDNQYPTNEDFTSDYKCDDFISSAYYELPLLKDYKKYTDQFAAIVRRIQDPLSTYYLDLNKYIKETNNLLNTLLNKGVFQSKKSSLVFDYGKFYQNREREASIPFLNNQIDELQKIINNGIDANEVNSQLQAMLNGLFDNTPVSSKDQPAKKNPYALTIEKEMRSKTCSIESEELVVENVVLAEYLSDDNSVSNIKVDKKMFDEAYKRFEKQMKELKKEVDAGRILNSRDLSNRISNIYSTFLDSINF